MDVLIVYGHVISVFLEDSNACCIGMMFCTQILLTGIALTAKRNIVIVVFR